MRLVNILYIDLVYTLRGVKSSIIKKKLLYLINTKCRFYSLKVNLINDEISLLIRPNEFNRPKIILKVTR